MTAGPTDAEGLAQALSREGYPCAVEAREGMALLLPEGPWPALHDATARRAVHGLASRFGFTHVAVEVLPGDEDGGGGPRDGVAGASPAPRG